MPLAQDAKPAPIELGHGKTELEIFMEPTCPFCKRTFDKLPQLVSVVGADKMTAKIRFVSQPWHLFSPIVTRSILAASATTGGTEAALKVMAHIFENREAYEFENHCAGPNMHRTPTDIIDSISKGTGVDIAEAFKLKSVDQALRWHAKYGRQNGIHVSPTFMINGLVEPNMSSGQSIEEWAKLLAPHVQG